MNGLLVTTREFSPELIKCGSGFLTKIQGRVRSANSKETKSDIPLEVTISKSLATPPRSGNCEYPPWSERILQDFSNPSSPACRRATERTDTPILTGGLRGDRRHLTLQKVVHRLVGSTVLSEVREFIWPFCKDANL